MKVWKNLERAMSDSFLKKIYYKNRDTLKLIWENSAHKDEPLNLVYSIQTLQASEFSQIILRVSLLSKKIQF